ncbi:uncharacterized protein TNCT_80391 [Trichonephila clavata]|uniref:T20D4.11-like domain-containing protein n=1 Tax=Trichonephila clavata TaxID=2740835 RepID=A0A8X6HE12_TRICU|nr:uncharacterized protein TNCT_80391 [Trichonephila clavata]
MRQVRGISNLSVDFESVDFRSHKYGYLKFAKCLNVYREKMEEKCGPLVDVEGSEKFTKEHCKQYENSFKCSFEEIQNNCGKDALILEIELMKPAHDFMELSCKDFQDLHDF